MRAARFLVLASVVCALAGGAWGQQAAKTLPASPPASTQSEYPHAAKVPLSFEVATVKPVDQHTITRIDLRVDAGGRLVIHAHRLAMLIAEAFNIPEWEIVGGDEDVVQAWYDVEGKPSDELRDVIPGGEYSEMGLRDARLRSMLQALLIDRFHLKFHMENRPGTIYELRRSDGRLRLKLAELKPETQEEDGKATPAGSDITNVVRVYGNSPVAIYQTSMDHLAQALASIRRTPVSDLTGLAGFYNFTSKTVVTKEDFQNGGPMYLLVSVVPEMGLKLVKANGLVEKFVIDSVEAPTAN